MSGFEASLFGDDSTLRFTHNQLLRRPHADTIWTLAYIINFVLYGINTYILHVMCAKEKNTNV